MKTIILLLFLITICHSAPQLNKLHLRNLFRNLDIHPRITGGNEAEPHSIPYQAFMELYDNTGGWYCGGSLISESYVLTAAHCTYQATQAVVVLGAHKPQQREDTQISLSTDTFIVHEEFDVKQILNDISLIQLQNKVTLTDAIQPVALPNRNEEISDYVGQVGKISGWGYIDGLNSTALADVLNYADVKIMSNAECGRVYGELEKSIICTAGGAEGKGTCDGDAGGPLAVDGVQVGVASFGEKDCMPGFPSGFTRITSYLDWLKENTDIV